jgi:hypothetical protein
VHNLLAVPRTFILKNFPADPHAHPPVEQSKPGINGNCNRRPRFRYQIPQIGKQIFLIRCWQRRAFLYPAGQRFFTVWGSHRISLTERSMRTSYPGRFNDMPQGVKVSIVSLPKTRSRKTGHTDPARQTVSQTSPNLPRIPFS